MNTDDLEEDYDKVILAQDIAITTEITNQLKLCGIHTQEAIAIMVEQSKNGTKIQKNFLEFANLTFVANNNCSHAYGFHIVFTYAQSRKEPENVIFSIIVHPKTSDPETVDWNETPPMGHLKFIRSIANDYSIPTGCLPILAQRVVATIMELVVPSAEISNRTAINSGQMRTQSFGVRPVAIGQPSSHGRRHQFH